MTLVTIGYLSAEDLQRFRRASALKELAEAGHQQLDVEHAVKAIVAYDELVAEFADGYDFAEGEEEVLINGITERIVEHYQAMPTAKNCWRLWKSIVKMNSAIIQAYAQADGAEYELYWKLVRVKPGRLNGKR